MLEQAARRASGTLGTLRLQVVLGESQVARLVLQDARGEAGEQRIAPGVAEGAIEVLGDQVAEEDAPDPVDAVALAQAMVVDAAAPAGRAGRADRTAAPGTGG